MDLTRRQLFRWTARLGASGTVAGWIMERSEPARALAPPATASKVQKGMLVDITRCVGCRMCEQACQEKWGLDGSAPEGGLSPQRWTCVNEIQTAAGTRYTRSQCFHCLEPSCASACPVGALWKTAEGAVIYDESRCIGCRYCMLACPFQVPRYEWGSWNPALTKCQFCFDRLAEGEEPACAAACPTGATQFGDRDRLLAEAKERIASNPGRYVPHIYGEQEAGGTAWLYLSDVPFEELGFRMDVPTSAPPLRTDRIMGLVPPLAGGLAAALGALAWWNRRQETEDAPPDGHGEDSSDGRRPR